MQRILYPNVDQGRFQRENDKGNKPKTLKSSWWTNFTKKSCEVEMGDAHPLMKGSTLPILQEFTIAIMSPNVDQRAHNSWYGI